VSRDVHQESTSTTDSAQFAQVDAPPATMLPAAPHALLDYT
jgi:hypothetical protein